jgi:hypothetical protein
MDHSTQGELFDDLCVTHKEKSDGREHMVLVDICTCGSIRYCRPKSVEAVKLPVGAVWFVDGVVHTHWNSRTPCFREPD